MHPDSVTLLDAGMGKTLGLRGVHIPNTIWSANALLVAPDVVLEIHKENIAAGANIITANTYGIIRSDLAKENIEHSFAVLNQHAGELAQQAVAETHGGTKIAGSLPPLNGSYRPDRVQDRSVLDARYSEQAKLLAPYVDLFLCETMSTITEGLAAASAAAETGKPVLVAFTLHDEDKACLRSGESLQHALKAMSEIDPLGVLVNCCLPERISDAMPVLASSSYAICGGYANGFTRVPQDWMLDGDKESDGRLTLRDDLSPTNYVQFVKQWLDMGANLVGGCCGTTAEHTAAIAAQLKVNSSP